MRIAVFSDVHANLEALQAFIEHVALKQVSQYIYLGDFVGYGANPNQCVRLIQTLPRIRFILGNHDNAVSGNPYFFNGDAGNALKWTQERLTKENLIFLKGLRENYRRGELFFCHANPFGRSDWYYISEKASISRTFFKSKAKILFAGHTHKATVITKKNFLCTYIRKPYNKTVLPIALLRRQIFLCGSIGQPRDGDCRGSYLIYDTERTCVEFYRFAYDHELAAKKILAAGLPKTLADRLSNGI